MRSNLKVMPTALFDSRGVAHYKYVPLGQTITKELDTKDVVSRQYSSTFLAFGFDFRG